MTITKYIPSVVLACAVAGGCVSEEYLTLSAEFDEDLAAVTELAPEEPRPPSSPPKAPDPGICDEVVGGLRDYVFVGDFSATTQAEVDLLAEYVAVTGNLVVNVDPTVDLSPLDGVRCIGGDVHICGTDTDIDRGYDGVDVLHSVELVGGSVIVDDEPAIRLPPGRADEFRDTPRPASRADQYR